MYQETAQADMKPQLGTASIAPVPQNPIRTMGEAHERLKELSGRFHMIMQKVIGTGYLSPKTQAGNAAKPTTGNLMDALQETAYEQHSIISSMNDAIAYLESKLQ